MEATRSSKMSVYNKRTRRHIPEGGILHSHRREYFQSYIILFSFRSRSRREGLLAVSFVHATDVLELQISHTCGAVVPPEWSPSTVDHMGRLDKQLSVITRNTKCALVNCVSGWIEGAAQATSALVLFSMAHGRKKWLGECNANGENDVI
jgi:hypothetical protein